LAVALKVPLTVKDATPVILALLQVWGSSPIDDGSMSPLAFRQDDFTVQLPTTLPPHGVTGWHDPLLPDAPPLPVPPPEPTDPPLADPPPLP